MTDLRSTIIPKSDQLNADDFLAESKTIRITAVKLVKGDQPVSINYENDKGKPYKPCKSMRRALVSVWGSNGDNYIGKSLALYCDPKVTWAGAEVGGIRISHMSDIDKPVRMSLTLSRGRKAPYKIEVLKTDEDKANEKELTDEAFEAFKSKIDEAGNMSELSIIAKEIKAANYDKVGRDKLMSHYSKVSEELRK